MASRNNFGSAESAESPVPIINLAEAPGEHQAWDRPKIVIYLWAIFELIFVTNAWQISSGLRVKTLRLFGAKIGDGVIFRPRTRVKFPWKLNIGDRSWIGEGVWIHNQDQVTIHEDVVVSQEVFITTGSHAHREDMRLITSPVEIRAGAWITTRVIISGGVTIGVSALVKPGAVVQSDIPQNMIVGGNPASVIGPRFERYVVNGDFKN